MKRDVFDELAAKVRNWGRWGADDQRGTVNHIGAEALMRATAAVSAGKLFSLGLRFDKDGPQQNTYRFNPKLYVTALTTVVNPMQPHAVFSDDVIHMPLQCATQWDALSHVHYDGVLYNDCKACDVLSVAGTSRNGVEHLASPGIMSRGVLLDVARLKGVDMLSIDYAITVDDLNEAVAKTGETIQPGDIVVVRTGHMRRFTIEQNRDSFNAFQPGLHPTCAEWLYDKSAGAVASDNVAVEWIGMETIAEDMPLPFHMLALRDMGCPLGEMWNLEALAADCAQDGRYSFLLSAPPLAITGAFGSPINPLALK